MGIYVLGMHRSGTSVLARAVGLAVGFNGYRGAAADNEEGHWEDPAVNWALESMLRSRGHDWASPPVSPLSWDPALDAESRLRLAEAVRDRADSTPWVIKDPRLCIALDAILELEQRPPVLIATFRNPFEVAASIQARDGYQFEYGIALWEIYNNLLLRQLRSTPFETVWVNYDALMASPETTMASIATALSRAGYSISEAGVSAACSALNPSLRHHAAGQASSEELSKQQVALLARLEESIHGSFTAEASIPEITSWARALVETRRPYQRLERDNRLLRHRLRRLRWAFRAVDRARAALGRPTPEDPFG
jgi:hypothetical protein